MNKRALQRRLYEENCPSLRTRVGWRFSLAFYSRATEQPQSSAPQFTAEGKLVRPAGYRKWVFVSSGYGMSYSQSPGGTQMFTNVFVTPAAYDYFAINGKWPDKTMFVLEVYGSTSRGSINKHGSIKRNCLAWTWK